MRTRLLIILAATSLFAAACGTSENGGGGPGPGHDDAATDDSGAGTDDGGNGTGGDQGAPAGDDGGCGLRTCMSANANCGPIGDGCGGTIECGNCVAPATCGGGGTPSRCGGTAACTPTTCAKASAQCGVIADGCGSTIDCGKCPAGQACGVGGKPYQCASTGALTDAGTPSDGGAGGCVPRTCAGVGANCGPIADGCGGLVDCGQCMAPALCGGGGKINVCGGTSPDGGVACTNLCLKQMQCPNNGTTSVSGTVFAPTPPQFGSPDPLYNALVYVPNSTVMPFGTTVSCDKCGAEASGSPLVSAVTGPDGKFTLTNVPVGSNIPLVIQLGRWRRQVTIPSVAACTNTALPADMTRLPRNKSEGDIPHMAMVTGGVDALECVLRKIGIADSEFTDPSGNGRVHLYLGDGGSGNGGFGAGANAPNGNAPSESQLETSATTLANYDMVMLACQGGPFARASADQQRLINYTNMGGRIFATHYSYVWLTNQVRTGKTSWTANSAPVPFNTTASWKVDQNFPPDPMTGFVDTSFPRGAAFSSWLSIVGAAAQAGQVTIHAPRHDVDGVVAPSQRWVYTKAMQDPVNGLTDPATLQHYTFNTPVGQTPDQQCGRVVYSDFHVTDSGTDPTMNFPSECDNMPMTAQEKVLEFMIFDLSSCIAPDMPPPAMCTPTTCAAQNASCGPIGDGCGGVIMSCGTCPAGQTCGGAGVPSQCGVPPVNMPKCTPLTCAQQNATCGPVGDGCGNVIMCGMCISPQTCGGGGVPSQCGAPKCTPVSCSSQKANCGVIADGCGGTLNCGSCTMPQTCGGGGVPNQCGSVG